MDNYDSLLKLKTWWILNPKLWFDSTPTDDQIITEKYENLIKVDYELDVLMNDINFGIGYIILYDQIVRHVTRTKNYTLEYVNKYLDIAIKFVELFYPKYKNNLHEYDYCFTLLPMRHSNIFKLQVFVMRETWNKIKNTNLDYLIKIYKNFLKATYERAVSSETYLNEYKSESVGYVNKEIFDPKCFKYFGPLFDEKTDDNSEEILNNVVKKLEKEVFENFENFQNVSDKKIILSLSGGVDSIVLSYILSSLKIDFVMVHINYANRGEICEKEKQYLLFWANTLQIKLYIKDIYEISRTECMKYDMRNLYEDYTRNARYKAYQDVAKMNEWTDCEWCVLLGHNHDDSIENILTNITNKTKYDNLKGMEYITKIKFNDDIIDFFRPMLSIKKEEIYKYAENKKILYFFDSTPKWSQRGMIRDIVRPALIQWNKSSLESLEELSEVLKDSIECINLLALNLVNELKSLKTYDIEERTIIIPNEISITKKDENYRIIKFNIYELKINKMLWSKFFKYINIKISSKSLNEFINKLEHIKNKFNSIQIKQVSRIQINKNNVVYHWKINENQLIIGFD